MDTVRVLIADDQPLIRNGLRASFEYAPDILVVGEAADGRDALHAVRRRRPDVVLMDISMPRMDGLEATRQIRRMEGTDARVVILTMYDRDEYLFAALRAGASGFILKDASPAKLVEAVREVAGGQGLLSPSMTRRLIAEFARRPAPDATPRQALLDLTSRERDVFRLLVQGYRNEDMARILVVGESTVKSHVQHLYQKLGVSDRVQVVIYAYENGLV
jgi:DNA-binding NarL/FixJ family response regulator